jgi:hypothetical protein
MQDGFDFGSFLRSVNATAYPEPPSPIHTELSHKMVDWILERVEFAHKSAMIIDVGAGIGAVQSALRDHGYMNTIGVNYLESEVAACQANGHVCIQGDMHNLPERVDIAAGFVKMICFRHILEHSPAPRYVLWQAHQLLASSGYIYIEVPAPGTSAQHWSNLNHESVHTLEGWTWLLVKTGFNVIDTATIELNLMCGPDQYFAILGQKPCLTPTTP